MEYNFPGNWKASRVVNSIHILYYNLHTWDRRSVATTVVERPVHIIYHAI